MNLNTVLIFFLLLLAPALSIAQVADSSSLWPFGNELDFGYYEERGVERIDSVVLQNNTDEPFIIENIRASCGCTAVEWPREPLAPGAMVSIPIAFRCTKGGYVEKHLDVYLSHLAKRERIYVIADCPTR